MSGRCSKATVLLVGLILVAFVAAGSRESSHSLFQAQKLTHHQHRQQAWEAKHRDFPHICFQLEKLRHEPDQLDSTELPPSGQPALQQLSFLYQRLDTSTLLRAPPTGLRLVD